MRKSDIWRGKIDKTHTTMYGTWRKDGIRGMALAFAPLGEVNGDELIRIESSQGNKNA